MQIKTATKQRQLQNAEYTAPQALLNPDCANFIAFGAGTATHTLVTMMLNTQARAGGSGSILRANQRTIQIDDMMPVITNANAATLLLGRKRNYLH